jgi:16S rRNA (cytosine1402-N4)-methyltransferase
VDEHKPVLAAEALEGLALEAGGYYVDATFGRGGHSALILQALGREGRLLALDRDPQAIAAGRSRFADEVRLTLLHAPFADLATLVPAHAHQSACRGVLFDLGVSSPQLDDPQRGFSFRADGPLDMRMDPTRGITAADVVNTYGAGDLTRILRRYGEERFARRIAAHIVRQRRRAPLRSTAELVALVYQAIPAPARRTGGHPAKRTFQALRIAVNDELDSLRGAIPAALDALAVAGRIVVLAYQSLEDRIVKRAFADAVASRTPVDLPVELPGRGPRFRSLTRGAERADAAEIERNPRSAAVRLRALQRVEHQVEPQQRATGKGDA